MMNLAKILKLRTYAENGGISEAAYRDEKHVWYTIKIKKTSKEVKLVASKIKLNYNAPFEINIFKRNLEIIQRRKVFSQSVGNFKIR